MVIALAGVGVAVALTRPWASSAAPPPAWTTAQVDRGAVSAQVTATGTLHPRVLVEISSQVSGRVAEVLVDYDDTVKKGQVLARLDSSTLDAQRAQARAALSLARANLERARVARRSAERTWARQKELTTRGALSAADLDAASDARDTAVAELHASEAQLEQATAQLRQTEANLGYATIVSPLEGVVIARSVDVGQTVAASLQAPTLFTIAADLSLMQINTSVTEADVGRIAAGMKVRFTVDAFPGKELPGVVRQVRNEAKTTANVVTYDAVIDVDNVDVALRPGMTANVTFVLAETKDTVRIPNAALRFKPTADQVMTMMGNKRPPGAPPDRMKGGGPPGGGPPGVGMPAVDGVVVWKVTVGDVRPAVVKTGLSDGSRSELLSGDVAPGDQLVTELRGKKQAMKLPGAF